MTWLNESAQMKLALMDWYYTAGILCLIYTSIYNVIMNLINKKILPLIMLLLLSFFMVIPAEGEYEEEDKNFATKRYDEILNNTQFEQTVNPPSDIKPTQDELISLLPKIDEVLYAGWVKEGIPSIWKSGEDNVFLDEKSKNLLINLGVKKALMQNYLMGEISVKVTVYEFDDVANTYSFYTVKHREQSSNLKIGRNVSESPIGITFWKSNYYIDLTFPDSSDKAARLFSVLAGQEISRNIETDLLPPDIAIKIPSLNRVDGSEKYCKSEACFSVHFHPSIKSIGLQKINPALTDGIITAEYVLNDKDKSKTNSSFHLLLTSFKSEEEAKNVYASFLSEYKLKSEKKEATLKEENGHVNIEDLNKKHILIKQKGNLFAVIAGIEDLAQAEKLLSLIPWPVEITYLSYSKKQ